MTKITRDQLLTRYTNSSVAVKFQWNKVSSLINPFQESLLKTCLPESCVYEENEEDITISEDDETFNNLPCELQKFNLERIMKHGGCRWRQRREWGAKEALPSFNCFIYNMRWGGLVADDGRWHHTAVRPTVILQKIDKKLVLHHFKLVRT